MEPYTSGLDSGDSSAVSVYCQEPAAASPPRRRLSARSWQASASISYNPMTILDLITTLSVSKRTYGLGFDIPSMSVPNYSVGQYLGRYSRHADPERD